jgi:hypothetical protein
MIAGKICGSLRDAGLDRVASRVARELLSQGVARALQLDRALKPVAAYRGSQSLVWRPHSGRATLGGQRCSGGNQLLRPDVCDCESLGLYAFRIP